ncbi:hypothetical protein SEA_VERITY_62 [Gordonia phage Verity]|uniref:Uncharacterized protein n=1 Tax=Gordonia phage Verity TaxID=2591211 RepID=A0A514DIW0_9CAUD|nr:hypothetical protein J1776_gp62 [Gordonia phage Verity]QDH93548.1 hypothetical protein SEA_VERITY_62 [Gordonia phage Verity]QPO16905.1 hypothetical protein SEA_DELREY21_62 [Gordonia phage Delrey21]QXN74188.1 hypothetical protein SEA_DOCTORFROGGO_62 [Gordonia phage DoctorFroggo]
MTMTTCTCTFREDPDVNDRGQTISHTTRRRRDPECPRHKLPGRRITDTLHLIRGRRVLTLRRQRPHGVQFATVYRWGRPRRRTNEFPQTPWPHLRIERDLELDYVEIYWPGIGGITASRLHYTSLLPDGRGHYLSLRDRWIKQGRGQM